MIQRHFLIHRIHFSVVSAVIFLGMVFCNPPKAQANVLFEGWFEVYSGSKKVGFVVEKYEFTDSKFKVTYYLKTNAAGNNITESVKGFAKNDLSPLSYAYTTKVGDTYKIIDAKFKGDTETLEINDGKTKSKQTKKIKKGTFLSQFLMYLILQQPDGLRAGKDYSYFAIAEEDGVTYKGDAFVKGEEEVKGRKAFKVLNEFKGEKFFTWVTAKGEPLLTRSPENNIDVRFADSREEATKGIMANLQDIRLLFGSVPGEKGSLSEKAEGSSTSDDKEISAGEKAPGKKSTGKKPNPKASHPGGAGTSDASEASESSGSGSASATGSAPAPATPNSGNGVEIKGVPPPKSPAAPSKDAAPIGK